MKKIKTDPIKTVLTISVGFMVVFLITKMDWALLVALAVGLVGMFSPWLTRKIDWAWMKLTYVLSLIVPNILLSVVFYVFLFPIALLAKLTGKKDPLMLRNKNASTFVESNKAFDDKTAFEKPW